MRAMTSRTSNGRARVARHDAEHLLGVVERSRASRSASCIGLRVLRCADDLAARCQRVRVVLGEVVGHAGQARVHVGAAEVLGATTSPVAAFTSGGPPRKIVPVALTMMLSSLIAGT
jgi:hypothetical protein